MKKATWLFMLMVMLITACGRGPTTTAVPPTPTAESAAQAAPAEEAPTPTPAPAAAGPVSHAFETGSAALDVTVPLDGRLAEDIEIETEHGVRFTAEAGTLLRTNTGMFVTGPVTIGIDDAGDFPRLSDEIEMDGVVRVYVLLQTASGPELLHVRFEPAAKLWLNLRVPEDVGDWVTYSPTAGNGRLQGPLPAAAGAAATGVLASPAEPDAGQQFPDWDPLTGLVRFDPNIWNDFFISYEDTGIDGFDHFIEAAVLGEEVEGDEIYELEISGADADDWPRVWSFELYTATPPWLMYLGGYLAGVGSGGLKAGQPAVGVGGDGSPGNPTGYAVSVIARNGKRYIQVRTRFKGQIYIKGFLCNEDATEQTPFEGIAEGGSPGEEDDGPYDPSIPITILVDGWGDYEDHLKIFDRLDSVFLTVDRGFDTGRNGTFFSEFSIHEYTGSAQQIAQTFPADWQATVSNRQIRVAIPCPPPVVITTPGSSLHVVDAETLETLWELLLGEQPHNAISSVWGDRVYVAAEDKLLYFGGAPFTDAEDISQLSVSLQLRLTLAQALGRPPTFLLVDEPTAVHEIPGLSAIALNPRGDALYDVTDQGGFGAYDARPLGHLWGVDGLPSGATDLAIALHGGLAAIATPGQVNVVDLLRREIREPLPLPAAHKLAFSSDGRYLAVSDPEGGLVRMVELATRQVMAETPTGRGAGAVVWTPDDDYLLVANRDANTVSTINTETFEVQQTPVSDAPTQLLMVAAEDVEGEALATLVVNSLRSISTGVIDNGALVIDKVASFPTITTGPAEPASSLTLPINLNVTFNFGRGDCGVDGWTSPFNISIAQDGATTMIQQDAGNVTAGRHDTNTSKISTSGAGAGWSESYDLFLTRDGGIVKISGTYLYQGPGVPNEQPCSFPVSGEAPLP